MVQIITSNKTLLGQSRNRYCNRPSRCCFDFYRLVVGNTTYKTTKLVYFILQDNTSYNGIYIYAPSLPMSATT